ncbi:MAG: glycine/betaine ABC transporter permease, partial [Silicimonas sp.]|nr:glycine/betaine ABC transporter permease [Silicimonas sp.]
MAAYEGVFDSLGLREWCDKDKADAPMSMAQLLAQTQGGNGEATADGLPFPSLDVLHEGCAAIGQTRDLTAG